MIGNTEIGRSLNQIVEIIRAGGVLLAETPSGTFKMSIGRHATALGSVKYSCFANNRETVYKSPLHAAQMFQGAVGYMSAQRAIIKHREDN